jgi:hypothetical protein
MGNLLSLFSSRILKIGYIQPASYIYKKKVAKIKCFSRYSVAIIQYYIRLGIANKRKRKG